MPRPRRFSEQATPARVAQLYAEGHSTRDLEKTLGLSRWCVTAWCLQNGITMRDRDDALEKQRYFRSIEEERAEAVRCVWPDCSSVSDSGRRLCLPHDLDVAEHDGRGCGWPKCGENRLWGPQTGLGPLCGYHQGRVDGRFG